MENKLIRYTDKTCGKPTPLKHGVILNHHIMSQWNWRSYSNTKTASQRLVSVALLLLVFLPKMLLWAQETPYFPEKLAENPSKRTAEEWCNFAMELYAQDQFAEAIRYFDEAVRIKPDHKMAYYYRAACKEDLKDEKSALADYQICMHLDAQFTEALFSKALLNYKIGNYENATQDFTRLLSLPKKETQTIYYQNISYGSERVTGGVFTLQSKNSEIYNYRGLARMKAARLDEALTDFDSAIFINPHNPNYYINRGLTKLKKQDKAGAITDYHSALKVSPDHPLALYNLNLIKGKSQSFSNLISFDDKFPPFYIKQGNENLEDNKFAQAIASYDTAIILGNEEHTTFFNRGFSKEKIGDLQGAIIDYSKTIALKADFAKAYTQRGNAYFKLKKYQKALREYEIAALMDGRNPTIFYNRGLTHYYLKNNAQARDDLKKAHGLGMKEAEKALKLILTTEIKK
jgi:tetratricopeptide (TPR) repeat protein